MRAGLLRQLVLVQRRTTSTDAIGQPLDTWEDVGPLYADIAGKTGFSAIEAAAQTGVPASVATYSFLVRFSDCQALGVDAGMRILHDGIPFAVQGVTRDFARRDRAYIVCDQGGALG